MSCMAYFGPADSVFMELGSDAPSNTRLAVQAACGICVYRYDMGLERGDSVNQSTLRRMARGL
jgi:hypothetical protein